MAQGAAAFTLEYRQGLTLDLWVLLLALLVATLATINHRGRRCGRRHGPSKTSPGQSAALRSRDEPRVRRGWPVR